MKLNTVVPVVTRTVKPVYRGFKDNDIVEDIIIAVDEGGFAYLLAYPGNMDTEWFRYGPRLENIPILGMTCEPGVYKCEIMFSVTKGYVNGDRRCWADDIEWYVIAFTDYDKPMENPFK